VVGAAAGTAGSRSPALLVMAGFSGHHLFGESPELALKGST
jgi:hypothetical protein